MTKCEAGSHLLFHASNFGFLSGFVIRYLPSSARILSCVHLPTPALAKPREKWLTRQIRFDFSTMSDQTPNQHEDEPKPRDDPAIGRAFRRSLAVLLLVGASVAAVSFVLDRKQGATRTQTTESDATGSGQSSVSKVPDARFTDITRQAGIDFVHNNGAYGDKLLPETMGGGVAFFDFDNDGAADLLFVNSTYWPGHVPAGKKNTTAALYHNDGQ